MTVGVKNVQRKSVQVREEGSGAASSESEKENGAGDAGGPLNSVFTIAHVLRLESESPLSKELGPVAPFEAPPRRPRLRFERRAIKGATLPRDERNQLDKKVRKSLSTYVGGEAWGKFLFGASIIREVRGKGSKGEPLRKGVILGVRPPPMETCQRRAC